EVEYLTNKSGQTKAVVIPIELWRHLLPKDDTSVGELSEGIEDYCLSRKRMYIRLRCRRM
ncbi:MAG: hypothetical protein V1749_11020, partial [Candidatus Desantisbacteria bacterium]